LARFLTNWILQALPGALRTHFFKSRNTYANFKEKMKNGYLSVFIKIFELARKEKTHHGCQFTGSSSTD